MSFAELVIFDCDGVLVDSERIASHVLIEMLAELGMVLSFEEAVDQFVGTSDERGLEIIRGMIQGEPPPDFLTEFSRRTQIAFVPNLTVVPGVEDVLSSLSIAFCVASNGSREKMNFTLSHTGLLSKFRERIYSANDVAKPKPAPDLFLHVARCHSVVPSRCVVIEDSPSGVTAARAAGMRVYGFTGMTPPQRLLEVGADVVFSSMADLTDLLRRDAVMP